MTVILAYAWAMLCAAVESARFAVRRLIERYG